MSSLNLPRELSEYFEAAFADFIAATYAEPQPLAAGCSWALAGKGKRIRPLLVLLSCDALGGDWRKSLLPAFAIEMVHTYSLVHDDLPCMDNDALRRGRPTVHVKFDEATALLVGDTLFCDACALLAGSLPQRGAWRGEAEQELTPLQRLAMVQVLTKAAGSGGIVLGQMQDLLHTGKPELTLSGDEVVDTYRKKTGSLMGAACAMGAIAAEASEEKVAVLASFGELLGSAYQIIDDLLDESELSGKTPGKDRDQHKTTLISMLDVNAAKRLAAEYTEEALGMLARLLDNSAFRRLQKFSNSLLDRKQ